MKNRIDEKSRSRSVPSKASEAKREVHYQKPVLRKLGRLRDITRLFVS